MAYSHQKTYFTRPSLKRCDDKDAVAGIVSESIIIPFDVLEQLYTQCNKQTV